MRQSKGTAPGSLVRLGLAYVSLNLSAAMEYRAGFLSQVVGMALNDSLMIFFWYLFFREFPTVGGWTLSDLLRLWAVVAVSFGLGTAIFGQCTRIATLIVGGQLDYYLELPTDVLYHILISRMSTSAWGDVAFGVFAFIAAGTPSPGSIALFLTVSVTGCAIFVAYHVIVGSLAFWIGNSEAVSNQASSALLNFATYPGSIFRGAVKIITFTVIPAAMLGHIPAELFREFSVERLAAVVVFAMTSVALAIAIFRRGLRRYESGGLIVMRG